MALIYLTVCLLFALCGAVPTCPPGWTLFSNSCYLFVDENVPWTAASVICRELDGRLVEVVDKAENDFLVHNMATNAGAENVWIGLTDFQQEGSWLWMSSKETPEYTNWGAGQCAENVWIGLTDFQQEGSWLWMSSKETPEYTNWGAGEPDNLNPKERGQDCVYVTPSGAWDDEACFYTVVRHSVCCEREADNSAVIG